MQNQPYCNTLYHPYCALKHRLDMKTRNGNHVAMIPSSPSASSPTPFPSPSPTKNGTGTGNGDSSIISNTISTNSKSSGRTQHKQGKASGDNLGIESFCKKHSVEVSSPSSLTSHWWSIWFPSSLFAYLLLLLLYLVRDPSNTLQKPPLWGRQVSLCSPFSPSSTNSPLLLTRWFWPSLRTTTRTITLIINHLPLLLWVLRWKLCTARLPSIGSTEGRLTFHLSSEDIINTELKPSNCLKPMRMTMIGRKQR